MAAEPEKKLYCFSRRAAKWEKELGYLQAECHKSPLVSSVSYRVKSPCALSGTRRIAFLADSHFTGSRKDFAIAEATVARLREIAPDMILAGGDVSGYSSSISRLWEYLALFQEFKCPKLAVPGNWEGRKSWLDKEYWREIFGQHGFHYLENELFDNGEIAVFGTDEISTGTVKAPVFPTEPRFRIVLSHNPDTVISMWRSKAEKFSADLALCGHTHGGQVRLPFAGAVASASVYGTKFDYGLFRRGAVNMIITSGLNHLSFPWRFLCRREVVSVTVES